MNYSDSVHNLQLEDKNIVLLGTAHVSLHSVEEVVEVINNEKPDTVCVELCPSRYEALSKGDNWKKMNLFKVIREGKALLLLANLVLSAFQKRIGEKLGIKPGAEMLEATKKAEEVNAEIILADRDVQITLKKTWRSLKFKEKMTVLSHLIMSVFVSEEITGDEVEKMKENDILTQAMESFAAFSPKMKEILIDERDYYLAEKIRTAPGKNIVAIVGAGHVPGIKKALYEKHDLKKLEECPPPSRWTKYVKWGIPILIFAIIGYGFFASDTAVSLEMLKLWILINGVLAAIGAILAWGHPVTVLSAFIAAPITSLNPTIAAGWVAGIVEAFMHKPQVKDFENLSTDISHLSGFWKNKVTRILLVVCFCNLGSVIGTFIGIPAIASLL